MTPPTIFDTVLLLALPASGKSEVRRYLANLSPTACRDDFHMGPTLQLDDYPYVHLMRRIDDELAQRGKPRTFFQAPDRSFQDPRQWGTLIELISEDYADLLASRRIEAPSAAAWLLERIDRAAKVVGAGGAALDPATRASIADALESEARELLSERNTLCAQDRSGRTIVIEFARGGAHGSKMPLAEPFGYRYSVGRLSPQVLQNAKILYVWVTPEESRRKNQERTDPNDPGSILHHGVPHEVMMNDYGCDDMDWLESSSKQPGTIAIEARGQAFQIPIARFDNRVDKTSFIREDAAKWKPEQVQAVHQGLKGALDQLAKT